MYFFTKILISAIIIAFVSELAKKQTVIAAVLVSLPLVSILSMIWLYWDTGDKTKVASLSQQIFWTVLPSLLFFIALPILLKFTHFAWGMLGATIIMVGGYAIYLVFLEKFGIRVF